MAKEENLPANDVSGLELDPSHRDQVNELLEELGVDAARRPDAANLIFRTMVAEATRGPYPPPSMLQAYKDIDEGLFRQIIEAARNQQAHRMRLETLATERNEQRLDRAQLHSFVIALSGIIAATAIYALLESLKVSMGWVFPSIVVIACVGGRPAATVLARWLGRERT